MESWCNTESTREYSHSLSPFFNWKLRLLLHKIFCGPRALVFGVHFKIVKLNSKKLQIIKINTQRSKWGPCERSKLLSSGKMNWPQTLTNLLLTPVSPFSLSLLCFSLSSILRLLHTIVGPFAMPSFCVPMLLGSVKARSDRPLPVEVSSFFCSIQL